MTTHRDRIEACLRNEVLDRPPVALWRHFPVDDQDPQLQAEAHVAFQGLHEFDLVKVTPASSFSVRDWGIEDRWEGDPEGTRTYSNRGVKVPEDWGRLPVLTPDAPHLARQLECLRILRRRLGPGTPILQTVFSPLAQAKHLAGQELLLKHIQAYPEAVEIGLETIAASTKLFIEAAAETGIDGIFYAVQHAQQRLLDRDTFVRLSRLADLMLLRAAGSLWCNLLHVHGEDIYFEAFADYPAEIINWHDRESGPSLAAAAEIWPRALCGGLSRNTLAYATADEVAAEAAGAFRSPIRDRLLLSTGCVVPIIAPHGNIAAAKHAAEAAGSDAQSAAAP